MSDRLSFKKGKVGRNAASGYEKTSALVGLFGTVGSGETKLEPGNYALLEQLNDMVAYGITEKNSPMLYRHISEYFRMGGKGAKLYVLNLTGASSYEELVGDILIKKLVAEADGQIFNLGFSYIPKTAQIVDGLNAEMVPAIKAAQVLADWARETNRTLHIAMECAGLGIVTAATMQNLRALKNGEANLDCPQVSVMIGQDWDFAETQTGSNKKYADVGTLLGCMAAQPVNYNVGEVATMILTNATRGDWVNAGLSSHEKVKDKEYELSGLNSKGYICGEYYSGIVCLNDDHVCAREVVDRDNNMSEFTIGMSRTNNKVARELYSVYLPKIKSTVPVDTTTGKLTTGMLKYFEGIGNDVFENMAAAGELSGGITEVDTESNLLYGDKILKVFYNWVPTGTIGRIEGVVNIKSSL